MRAWDIVTMRRGEVEIVPGVVGPREFVEERWVTPGGHATRMTVSWDEQLRRYVCDELTITRQCQPASPPVTTESMRNVAVGLMIKAALVVKTNDGPEDPSLRDLPNPDECEPWGRTPPADLAAGGPTDRALRWAAHMYRLGIALDEPPTKIVQEALKLSRTTAIRWVMAARDRGYLGSAEVGKAGERAGR